MPAIAGVVGPGFGPPDVTLHAMMSALAAHGVHGSRTDRAGSANFGVQFHHTVPEDEFDRQPYAAGSGRYLIIADARVDNREELAAALGMSAPELQAKSDAELLVRGWEQWKLSLTDRLLGDYTIAVWDCAAGDLTLIRGPLSSRPLFFHLSGNSVAFASLPSALLAVPGMDRDPDLDEFARLLGGGLFQARDRSFFAGIQSVPQGQARVLRSGIAHNVQLWSPGEYRLDISVAEAGERMRHELDRATRAQTRRRSGQLGCMLSSGRDSSAVMAAAALVERSDVLAFTAAPGAEVEGLLPRWVADESGLAAKAVMLAGARHLVCRSEDTGLSGLLDEVAEHHFQPFNNPVNLPWISQLCRAAQSSNVEMLVGGAAGNFTISLGGPSFLADYWRERGLGRWLRLVRGMHRNSKSPWLQIAAQSFGSLIPPRAYALVRTASGRSNIGLDLPLLREPYRKAAEDHRRERLADLRAKPSRRQHYAELIRGIEPGDKYSLSCWGVDVRDPTADRRLAELCLSMPVEAFVGPDHFRPAYYHAFKDRLPREVVEGRHAGAQAADWFLIIQPDEVLAAFRRYSRNAIVNEMFDLYEVERKIANWPQSGAAADALYDEYCNQLLGGLAVASFISAHFPG